MVNACLSWGIGTAGCCMNIVGGGPPGVWLAPPDGSLDISPHVSRDLQRACPRQHVPTDIARQKGLPCANHDIARPIVLPFRSSRL